MALDKPQHMHGRRQLETETTAELQLRLQPMVYNGVNYEQFEHYHGLGRLTHDHLVELRTLLTTLHIHLNVMIVDCSVLML